MESVARALFHGLGAVGQNFKPHECAPSQTAARPCGHRMGAHSPGRPRAAPTSQLGGRTDRPDRLGESRAEPRGWTAAAAAPRSTRAAAFRGFCCRDGRCSGRECSAPTPCNRAETSRRDHPNRSRTKPRRWGAMPTESGVHAKRGHCEVASSQRLRLAYAHQRSLVWPSIFSQGGARRRSAVRAEHGACSRLPERLAAFLETSIGYTCDHDRHLYAPPSLVVVPVGLARAQLFAG